MDYALGAGPTATATGLFNNDTIPDLVVANYADGTVSVLRGNGNGTFQPAVSSPTGGNPSSVAVGDFNGDGKMDVATANGADVSVLIGNGDGTFRAPTSITVGDSPTSVAVGDFNADGKMDLGVVSNTYYPGYWGYWGWYPGYYVGRASVLIGTGTGSFGAPVTTWLGGGYHTGGAAADFNGDGRSDLAVANADNGTVGVALADLSGALQGPTYYSAGATPGSIIAADVSGDGKADVVTANWYSNTVSVLLGNGLGGFGTATTCATGETAVGVAVGDFNGPGGDGKADIAVATGFGGLSVLLGRGGGTFALPVPVTNGSYLSGVSASDFNGDGWLDAAAANSSTNSASVFVNDHVWPDVTAPALAIGDVTVTEGNSGTVAANFQVSLSAPSTQSVSVQYTTVDGSATAASGDYQAKTGTLTFAPGQTTQTIPVLVNGDRVGEWDENFSVRLSNPTNAFVSDPTGWGTIHDDEPTIDITSFATGPEGNSGTSLLAVTVNLSAPYDAPVSVDFATADLTPDEEYWYGPAA
ncbi:MAG: VCBS repeat-containing protein, partial [Zavarzinella sp.]|nr:VCBS repeat-containing protein [Zavarzinella sp.]